jgi:hypothetical protein
MLVVKIALGIILALVVLTAGCAALIGTAAKDPEVKKAMSDLDKASDDLSDMSGDNDAEYESKMAQVAIGMPEEDLLALMPAPRDTQEMQSEYGTNSTYYWGSWQVTVENGRVTSKNRW